MKKISILLFMFTVFTVHAQGSKEERQAKLDAKKGKVSVKKVETVPEETTLPEIKTIGSYTEKTLPENEVLLLSKTDEIDGSAAYRVSKKLICFKEDKSIGFIITPVLKYDLTTEYFSLNAMNIGNCDEEGEIAVLFDDGSNLFGTSFTSFNCEGSAAFMLKPEKVQALSSKAIKKIRYTNGRSGENYTYELKDSEKDYFIKVFELLNKREVFEYK